MIGFQIKDGFIDFIKTDFVCPFCGKKYNDTSEKYLNKCNKNKSNTTRIKCTCGEYFYVAYNYKSEAVAFKN